uniref:AlNc14C118G6580 protein n=1 Tax=Albugo laibachii Nc14 TaxID=890382 RepID=F0WJ49_9STRA|nr:AlNc14C118G6580 [Albugo laibachii Nc14]|eukprot:CCA21295.1 AlNc14C118G6580 [Albugo laibachii Nc14]
MNYRILHQAGIYHGISGLRVELRRLLEPDEDTRTEYILMAFYVNEDGKSEELLKSFEPVSLNSERVDDRYQRGLLATFHSTNEFGKFVSVCVLHDLYLANLEKRKMLFRPTMLQLEEGFPIDARIYLDPQEYISMATKEKNSFVRTAIRYEPYMYLGDISQYRQKKPHSVKSLCGTKIKFGDVEFADQTVQIRLGI